MFIKTYWSFIKFLLFPISVVWLFLLLHQSFLFLQNLWYILFSLRVKLAMMSCCFLLLHCIFLFFHLSLCWSVLCMFFNSLHMITHRFLGLLVLFYLWNYLLVLLFSVICYIIYCVLWCYFSLRLVISLRRAICCLPLVPQWNLFCDYFVYGKRNKLCHGTRGKHKQTQYKSDIKYPNNYNLQYI